MCGLAGVAGNTNAKIRDAFLDLLLITQLRGNDATGVFTVSNTDVVKHCKDVGIPNNLFDRKSFDQTMIGIPKVMAGHCRAKTIGENTRENAHPYDFDSLIGMHNGTLRNYHNMEGYNYKKTDSHCLYSNIDKYGVEAAVKDVDPEGAWALVWWDKTDNRLCFLRNDKRPLWFAWTKDKTAVFWASEPWMFGAVSRHVELWDGKEEGKETVSPYFQLPTNTCWSFTVNGIVKANERYLTFHQPREVKAEGKKHVGFWRPSSGNGGEVTNPFSPEGAAEAAYQRFHGRNKDSLKLDDKVDDIPLGVSTSINSSLTKSETGSSNVLDFRLGGKHGSNSKKKTLSLPGLPSNDSQQNNKGSGLDGSQKSCSKMSNQTSQPFPHVSVRDVIGTDYITHNGSGCEIPLHEFEARTGSRCSYCGTLIGDLSEVAAFTNRAMTGFVCMSCVEEPKVAVVG